MPLDRVLGSVAFLVFSLAQVAVAQTIVWTDANARKIQRKDVSGGQVATIVQFPSPLAAYQIHYDPITAKLYYRFSEPFSLPPNSFQRANLDGSEPEDIPTPSTGIFSLNVELRRLYWTGDSTAGFDDTVNWSELDGSGFGSHTYPNASVLTLEGLGDDLYFGAGGGMTKGVWRSDADGSNEEFIHGNVMPLDLAYDPVEDKLYLTTDSDVVRLNTDGSGYQVIVFGAVSDHVAVDYQGRKVYWIHGGDRIIRRANLNGSNVENFVTPSDAGNPNFNPVGLTIVYNSAPISTLSVWGLAAMAVLLLGSGLVVLRKHPSMRPLCVVPGRKEESPMTGRLRPCVTKLIRTIVLPCLGGLLPSAAVAQTIVWTDGNARKIQRKDVSGGAVATIVQFPSPQVAEQIHYDPIAAKLYYLYDNGPTIVFQRANLDGTDAENIPTPSWGTFALNVELRKLNWIRPANVLNRCNLDGTLVESHVYPPSSFISMFTLEAFGDKLFFGETGFLKGIWRADADGSNEQFLHTTQVPLDMAFDPVESKLYVGALDEIVRINSDGSDFQVVRSQLQSDAEQVEVDYQGRKLYWVENWGNVIRRSNLDGSNVETFLTASEAGNPDLDIYGLTIVYDSEPIPSLSGWGLMGMAVLVVSAALVVITRRRLFYE